MRVGWGGTWPPRSATCAEQLRAPGERDIGGDHPGLCFCRFASVKQKSGEDCSGKSPNMHVAVAVRNMDLETCCKVASRKGDGHE
jgi:hypothetical protein